MRKYLLCSILAAILLQTGISAAATDAAADSTAANTVSAPSAALAPSAAELQQIAEMLQISPEDLRQQAQDGTTSTGHSMEINGYTLDLGENNGARYIVSLFSQATNRTTYGVFDFAAGTWLVPCTYDAVYLIPNNRYFLITDGAEASTCYEAEADGTIDTTPLPIEGKVLSVDKEGYVTLVQYVTVRSSNPDYADVESGEYAKMALLDNQYQMVLDYIAEDAFGAPITFENGVAVIYYGSTKQEYAGHNQVTLLGGKTGLINRRGEWVGRQDNADMYRDEWVGRQDYADMYRDANNRIFAQRDNAWYLLAEDGTETPLPNYTGDDYEMRVLCGDWARDAIEQAKTRSLVPEKIDGYYTLDIFREEFCSLLMNLYRALGKEAPALDSAPTFTDCDLADVRAAAALGVVSGYDDGAFRPRSRITREEAAAMLSRFTALFRETDESAAEPYQDDAEIGSWAKPQVYAMRSAGIMSGTSSGFSPKGAYTIEQAISVANRLYDLLKG